MLFQFLFFLVVLKALTLFTFIILLYSRYIHYILMCQITGFFFDFVTLLLFLHIILQFLKHTHCYNSDFISPVKCTICSQEKLVWFARKKIAKKSTQNRGWFPRSQFLGNLYSGSVVTKTIAGLL